MIMLSNYCFYQEYEDTRRISIMTYATDKELKSDKLKNISNVPFYQELTGSKPMSCMKTFCIDDVSEIYFGYITFHFRHIRFTNRKLYLGVFGKKELKQLIKNKKSAAYSYAMISFKNNDSVIYTDVVTARHLENALEGEKNEKAARMKEETTDTVKSNTIAADLEADSAYITHEHCTDCKNYKPKKKGGK